MGTKLRPVVFRSSLPQDCSFLEEKTREASSTVGHLNFHIYWLVVRQFMWWSTPDAIICPQSDSSFSFLLCIWLRSKGTKPFTNQHSLKEILPFVIWICMQATFFCGFSPFYVAPDCARLRTIWHTQRSKIGPGLVNLLLLWWLCAALNALMIARLHGPDPDLCEDQASRYKMFCKIVVNPPCPALGFSSSNGSHLFVTSPQSPKDYLELDCQFLR